MALTAGVRDKRGEFVHTLSLLWMGSRSRGEDYAVASGGHSGPAVAASRLLRVGQPPSSGLELVSRAFHFFFFRFLEVLVLCFVRVFALVGRLYDGG